MKIVLATPLYPPEAGGPATYAKLIYENLLSKKDASSDEIILVKFSEIRHLPKGIRHFEYFWKILQVAGKADILLVLDPVSTGFPAMLAARILGKPLVVKIVGDFAWEQGSQRYGITASLDTFVRQKRVPFAVACLRVVETMVARNATTVIVPSEYLKGIVTAWGINPEKIAVIYNSVDVPMPNDHVEPTKGRVVSVGRLVPWKGMEGIIEAIAEIQKRIPEASFTIVGDGPDKKVLMKRGKELLGDTITFTGILSNSETLAILRTSDVFVLNSTYEGLSHLLIETLALGCAIVASDAGGNPELIENEVNGLLVPVGDKDALTAAIERLMTDRDLAARLRAAAHETARRFSLSIMITKTHDLLTSIIHSANSESTS